jgi:hypothetical protein
MELSVKEMNVQISIKEVALITAPILLEVMCVSVLMIYLSLMMASHAITTSAEKAMVVVRKPVSTQYLVMSVPAIMKDTKSLKTEPLA